MLLDIFMVLYMGQQKKTLKTKKNCSEVILIFRKNHKPVAIYRFATYFYKGKSKSGLFLPKRYLGK